MAAWLRGFIKLCQQQLAAARCGFTKRQHRIDFLQFDLFLHCFGFTVLYALAQQYPIVEAITQPRSGGQTIAPCAARFLVKMLDGFGHVQVGDKAHIGLVYAHAKRHSGNNNHIVVLVKAFLVFLAHRHVQPCVVRPCIEAVFF